MKVSITIDDVRSKSKLSFDPTLIFTKISFFYTISNFTEPHQGTLNDIEGLYQIYPENI